MRFSELFIFVEQVSLEDYYWEKRSEKNEFCRPWLYLASADAINSARCSIFAGFALTALYHFGYEQRKLKLSARSFTSSAHVIYKTMPYTCFLGMIYGFCYRGVCDLHAIQPYSLQEQIQRERDYAEREWCKWMKRKEFIRTKLESRESWYGKLYRRFSNAGEQSFEEKWTKMLGLQRSVELNKTQEDFLPIHGVLWVGVHSTIHDFSQYFNNTHEINDAQSQVECMHSEDAQLPTKMSWLESLINNMYTSKGHLTKLQTDYLMSKMYLWMDSIDNIRWLNTAYAGIILIATYRLFWSHQGSLFYRINHSIATAITLTTIISLLKVDTFAVTERKKDSHYKRQNTLQRSPE